MTMNSQAPIITTNATSSSNNATRKTTSTIGLSSSKALQYLIDEDPLLQSLSLTSLSNTNNTNDRNSTSSSTAATSTEPPAYTYAAALLKNNKNLDGSDENNIQQRAEEALSEVERKLALVESLSERISREKPEHVAAPLLKLHGYNVFTESNSNDGSGSMNATESATNSKMNSTTISSTLERCDRLKRQAQVLDSVANRVESTLIRGMDRMSLATGKLERVLKTSQVLKMIMRLKFEAKKVMGSGLDFDSLISRDEGENTSIAASHVDLRDLTRAAASVSIMEELLNHDDLKNQGIEMVEQMRPEAERIARAVRKAAAGLLAEQQHSSSTVIVSATTLGATLQVYYHLGELPDAAWNAVCLGLEKAEAINEKLLNHIAVKKLVESAKQEAKKIADDEISSNGITDKKQKEVVYERTSKKKMREKKAEAATNWANGVSEAALQVWNLHRVLSRKSDPVSRENFLDVVKSAPVPDMFAQAQQLQQRKENGKAKVSIFALFWNQMCISLGTRIETLLKDEQGAIASDVASFYPSIRAAALEMLNYIQDTMQAGSLSGSTNNMVDDINGDVKGAGCGIMGGSAVLDDAIFFGWESDKQNSAKLGGLISEVDEDGAAGFGAISADTWTKPEAEKNSSGFRTIGSSAMSQTSSALSSILASPEWFALQIGLYPMQRAFLKALNERLNAPLKSLFVDNRVVDENGIDIRVLPSLPSLIDLKLLEMCLRAELSIADPREGGGEFNMTTMISECIVDVVENLCSLAKNATSGASEENLLHDKKGTATEELLHDMNVAAVMASLTTSLRNLPESTFVKPYRPAHTLQHEEAANMCQIALLPAIHEIESMVKSQLIIPLCRVLNKRIAIEIATMHRGTYMESISSTFHEGSFVQEHLAGVYENIATNILSRLPEEYGGMVSSILATFSIYCFVSNASLVRPLGESGRLKITQDLADLELTLEQLMFKGGASTVLNQINDGKPYAELRAVRQMLFWTGLENEALSSEQIAKAFFREAWVKSVRPSTIFHFLFTFAPKMLSSPHHAKRIIAEDYVNLLVNLDGSVEDGEPKAWMTTMKCCDVYQQRESVDGGVCDGDRRVPAILMIIGPELLRRRRQ